MLQHARKNQHHFQKENVFVLASEQNWEKKGIKEALYIKALNPSINIDPGRHNLSAHFDKMMLSPSLPLQHPITPKLSPSSTQPLAAKAALEKIRPFLKLSPCPPNRSHSRSLHKKPPIQHGPKTSPQHLPRVSLNENEH